MSFAGKLLVGGVAALNTASQALPYYTERAVERGERRGEREERREEREEQRGEREKNVEFREQQAFRQDVENNIKTSNVKGLEELAGQADSRGWKNLAAQTWNVVERTAEELARAEEDRALFLLQEKERTEAAKKTKDLAKEGFDFTKDRYADDIEWRTKEREREDERIRKAEKATEREKVERIALMTAQMAISSGDPKALTSAAKGLRGFGDSAFDIMANQLETMAKSPLTIRSVMDHLYIEELRLIHEDKIRKEYQDLGKSITQTEIARLAQAELGKLGVLPGLNVSGAGDERGWAEQDLIDRLREMPEAAQVVEINRIIENIPRTDIEQLERVKRTVEALGLTDKFKEMLESKEGPKAVTKTVSETVPGESSGVAPLIDRTGVRPGGGRSGLRAATRRWAQEGGPETILKSIGGARGQTHAQRAAQQRVARQRNQELPD